MYEAVVIGVSAGGMQALKTIFSMLPETFSLPVAVVQHVAENSDSYFIQYLDRLCPLIVKEAEDNEFMNSGTIYIAPPRYHLLIDPGPSFSLSVDQRVNFSCPSIDVLFESAADVFQDRLIGLILTGANADGSIGLKSVKARGGLAIVQNPATAEVEYMPQAAIKAVSVDYVVHLEHVAPLLIRLSELSAGEVSYESEEL